MSSSRIQKRGKKIKGEQDGGKAVPDASRLNPVVWKRRKLRRKMRHTAKALRRRAQDMARSQAERQRKERKGRDRKMREIMRELQGQESTYKKEKMIGRK